MMNEKLKGLINYDRCADIYMFKAVDYDCGIYKSNRDEKIYLIIKNTEFDRLNLGEVYNLKHGVSRMMFEDCKYNGLDGTNTLIDQLKRYDFYLNLSDDTAKLYHQRQYSTDLDYRSPDIKSYVRYEVLDNRKPLPKELCGNVHLERQKRDGSGFKTEDYSISGSILDYLVDWLKLYKAIEETAEIDLQTIFEKQLEMDRDGTKERYGKEGSEAYRRLVPILMNGDTKIYYKLG